MRGLLTDAIIAAGRELEENHGWTFTDEDFVTGSDFVNVFTDHISPLLDKSAMRKAHILALEAELKALKEGAE